MNRQALILCTSHDKLNSGKPTGAYLPEVVDALSEFTKAGYAVQIASPLGGSVPHYGSDNPEDVGRIVTSRRLSDLRPEDFSVVFCAGGHGTMWDFPTIDIGAWLDRFYCQSNDNIIGMVCHGVSALVGMTCIFPKDVEVSCFTNEEELEMGLGGEVPFFLERRLAEQGYTIRKRKNWDCCISIDLVKGLVTGQNPASATLVAQTCVELIESPSPRGHEKP